MIQAFLPSREKGLVILLKNKRFFFRVGCKDTNVCIYFKIFLPRCSVFEGKPVSLPKSLNMKKLVFLASAILAAMAASCSQEGVKYVVKGTGPEDGVLVRLIDRLSDTPIDSAVVKGGVFQMKGRTAENAFLGVKADGSGWSSLMINDGVPVQVSLADSTLTGSDNNTRLTEYDLNTNRALNAVNAVITEISNLPEEEQAARMPAYFKAMENLNSSYLSIFEENKDNYIPVAFLNMIPDLFGPEKLNELMESGAVFANHPYAQELKRKQDEAAAKRKAAEEKKKAIVGQKFLDLEEADIDGNMHKLSEYVGQGKCIALWREKTLPVTMSVLLIRSPFPNVWL